LIDYHAVKPEGSIAKPVKAVTHCLACTHALTL